MVDSRLKRGEFMSLNRMELLEILDKHIGNFISGEQIASHFGVSRVAVSKAIAKLREDGYKIESKTNFGYSLDKSTDIIYVDKIKKFLSSSMFSDNIEVHSIVDSTNNLSRDKAQLGAPEGIVVISNEQTAGKGRRGRTFQSPVGGGIYMSILLRPGIHISRIQIITLIAAISVVRALDKAVGISASIKWVNDILVDNKKICGILTEGSIDAEDGATNFAIVGIGINVKSITSMPDDIKEIATDVVSNTKKHVCRCELIAQVLMQFDKIYSEYMKSGQDKKIISIYKENLCMLGRDITVISQNKNYIARAVDITESGGLLVRNENGEIIELNSGEISTKI